MANYKYKPCNCGSGEIWFPVEDARGIFVTYACSKCEKEKLGGYRKDIFTDSQYEADEEVEPEDPYGWNIPVHPLEEGFYDGHGEEDDW